MAALEDRSAASFWSRNAAGQTHIVANTRPLSTVLHFSRLLGEQLADTPCGKHLATSAD